MNKETWNNIVMGKSEVILNPQPTMEDVAYVMGELSKDLLDMDINKNTANKMLIVDYVIRNICSYSDETINIKLSDYIDNTIYKHISKLASIVARIIMDEKTDLYDLYLGIASAWADVLVVKHKDICKETECMVLDLTRGKNFYFIIKK